MCLFPLLNIAGLLDERQTQSLKKEHRAAVRLILELCDGVSEGDWEKVLRLSSQMLHFMLSHMQEEEAALLGPANPGLSPERVASLAGSFRELESRALDERGRAHYVALVGRLCQVTGIEIDGLR